MTASLSRRVWILIGVLVVAANLPYLVGALNAPAGGAFTGNALEQTRVDYNSNLARIQLGLRGEWLQRIVFTPEDHPGHLLNTYYLALGQLARFTGLSAVAAYHLGRISAMILMWWVSWRFINFYLEDDRARWWAFLLATVVGGLGWVLYFVMPEQTASLAPVEFWLLDAYPFLAALTFPHFSMAVATLVGYWLALEHWRTSPTWRGALALGVLAGGLGLLQPFDLLLTALVTGLLAGVLLWRRKLTTKHIVTLVPVGMVHAAVVGYDYYALHSHPVWQAFLRQNLTLSPPPVYYVFAYAWLLIPAVGGLIAAIRRREGRLLLPALWVLTVPLLLYAPLQTQRRFVMGWQVGLGVFGALGVVAFWQWWAARGWSVRFLRLALTAGLLFATLSHVLLVASSALLANPQTRPQLFLERDQLAAFDWLKTQPVDTVVFSSFETGGAVAAFTGRRVYIGHWIETPDFEARQALAERFYTADAMSNDERQALLMAGGIDVVWWEASGEENPALWRPATAEFLAPAFESGNIALFEVTR
ncbi:MAG: hypothetical protein Kow0077_10320 [Anaerolineae bacterium]